MGRYFHAKYQVVGNFPPGQFGFSNKKEADQFAKEKIKDGYTAKVEELTWTKNFMSSRLKV